MPIPVLTVSQMRAWEQATWQTGQTESAVIRRVGEIIAHHVRRRVPVGNRVLILAGRGHNGDDARWTEPHLRDRQPQVLNVTDPVAGLAQVADALAHRPALVVDGLFGTGLNRPLDAPWVALIEQVNRSGVPVLSVDVPSGLSADLGEPMGAAIEAAITLTVGAPKWGLLSAAAAPYVGRLEVEPDIGLVPCPFTGDLLWTLGRDFAAYPPARSAESHKGTYGHLMIVAGSLGYHGAAVLAARGAQRAQPGLITLVTQPDTYTPIASQTQAVMVHPWTGDGPWPGNVTAWVLGPGLAASTLSPAVPKFVARLWAEAREPVVLDASALPWIAKANSPPETLRVLTPHPGEAARLLGIDTAAVQLDRVSALRALSSRFGGCWVVLKGRGTLVGRAEGPVWINPSGNAHLAQGGSGDLLAGYLGGLLAQPLLQTDPGLALRYAVWQHGAAADALSAAPRPNWTTEELIGRLGAVVEAST